MITRGIPSADKNEGKSPTRPKAAEEFIMMRSSEQGMKLDHKRLHARQLIITNY